MPAPAVYVVVAIGTVAAIYAFKELIYDPHVHPKVQAWQETMAARRRARKERTRRTAPVSARAPADSDDDDVPLASIRRRGSRDSEGSATTPVELENLVASEVQEWRSGVDVGRNQAGLRLRRLPDSQASSTLGSSVSLLDESDVFSISHTPLEPTPLHRPSSALPVDHTDAQAPDSYFQPFNTAAEHQWAHAAQQAHAAPSRGTGQAPALPAIHIPTTLSAPGLPTPTSLRGRASPSVASSRVSSPDSDLLTASISGAYFTPHTTTGASPFDDDGALSPQPGSPFSLGSPGVLSPPSDMGELPDDFQSVVGSEDDMFSMPSHVSSSAGSDGSDDDEYDNVSAQDSEASSWAGVDARRSPPPQV